MAKDVALTKHRADWIARTKAAREAHGVSQADMAELLGFGTGSEAQGRYKQYEIRSYLPHAYVRKFCKICGVDLNWYITGEGHGPALAAPKRPRKSRRVPKRAKIA